MKAAFFDIDGVLTKGFAIQKFWDYLAEQDIINPEFLSLSKQIFDKFRKGQISYREMGKNSMKYIALSFKGATQKEIKSLSKKFSKSSNIDLFSYSAHLVKLLRDTGLKLIAISGSNIEFVENYKKLFGFGKVYGTEFEITGGRYTGLIKFNLGLSESKRKIIEGVPENVAKFIGFGDTDQDIPILENVEIPIAINPNKELEIMASEKGWTILKENDKVVETVRGLIE